MPDMRQTYGKLYDYEENWMTEDVVDTIKRLAEKHGLHWSIHRRRGKSKDSERTHVSIVLPTREAMKAWTDDPDA